MDDDDWSRAASKARGRLFTNSKWMKDDEKASETDGVIARAIKKTSLSSWGPNTALNPPDFEASIVSSRPMGELSVKSVKLFPSELELGIWPSDYELSDHGLLVVDFLGQALPAEPESERINPIPYAAKNKSKDST